MPRADLRTLQNVPRALGNARSASAQRERRQATSELPQEGHARRKLFVLSRVSAALLSDSSRIRRRCRRSTTFSIGSCSTVTATSLFPLLPDRSSRATSSRCIRVPIDPEHVEQISSTFPELTPSVWRALCHFRARTYAEFGRNYLSLGSLFFQRGYLDQAEASFQQALPRRSVERRGALRHRQRLPESRTRTRRRAKLSNACVKLQANYPDTLPDAWNNLGVIATREAALTIRSNAFSKRSS